MLTALRKMGNSVGMIVPRAILGELAVGAGTTIDLKVEHGCIVATPVVAAVRKGWAASAIALDTTDEERDWHAFANEGDERSIW